jgi:hypothetical protein
MKTDTIQLWDEFPYVKLQSYVLKDSTEFQKGKKRPAVIVCPGGPIWAPPIGRRSLSR